MIVTAFGTMLMFRFVIVIVVAFRPVNVLFFVRRLSRGHLMSPISCSVNGDGVYRYAYPAA